MTAIPQAAALPFRDGKVCLVTSRSRRRWVIPKGMVDPGHTPTQAAQIEAWEEAGLVGVVTPEPIGTYTYDKAGREFHVTVYEFRVADEKSAWPERGLRTRVWVTPDEAAGLVKEPGLQSLLRRLRPDATPAGSPAD